MQRQLSVRQLGTYVAETAVFDQPAADRYDIGSFVIVRAIKAEEEINDEGGNHPLSAD